MLICRPESFWPGVVLRTDRRAVSGKFTKPIFRRRLTIPTVRTTRRTQRGLLPANTCSLRVQMGPLAQLAAGASILAEALRLQSRPVRRRGTVAISLVRHSVGSEAGGSNFTWLL